MHTPEAGHRFVAELPGELAGQQAVLVRLMDAVKAGPEARWLVLSCSIARGAADVHSDVDLGLGLDESAMPAALDGLSPFVRQGGDVLDTLEHRLPRFEPRPHRHLFVQYANGVQVDITAAGASYLQGYPVGEVGVPDAAYGLVAVVDRPDAGMPPGIERTVVGLDAAELLAAAHRVADLLDDTGRQAARQHPAVLPTALAQHVRRRLSQL